MDENPEKENFHGVGRLTWLKKPRTETGRTRGRVEFMGGRSALPNNPNKGHTGKHKIKIDRMRDALASENKCNVRTDLDGTYGFI